MIYIVVFLLSLVFTHLASRAKGRFAQIIFSILALLFPVLLAGFRDSTVGTDTQNYITFFDIAIGQPSLKNYIDSVPDLEIGYVLLTYLSAKITLFSQVYLIIVSAFILIPVYLAAFNLKNKLNPTMVMSVFYLLFYNESLNLMRQYLAMGIILLAVSYLILNKKMLFFIGMSIAISFHTTAILALPIYFIPRLVNSRPIRKNALLYVIVSIILIAFVMGGNWMGIGFGMGLNDRQMSYLENSSNSSISMSTFIVYFTVFAALFYKSMKQRQLNYLVDFYTVMSLIALSLLLTSLFSHTFYRFSLIFSVASCLSIPSVCYRTDNNIIIKPYSKGVTAILLLLFFAYWYFAVVIRGSNETYPYNSILLGL